MSAEAELPFIVFHPNLCQGCFALYQPGRYRWMLDDGTSGVTTPGYMFCAYGYKVAHDNPLHRLSQDCWVPIRKFAFEAEAVEVNEALGRGELDVPRLIEWISNVQ